MSFQASPLRGCLYRIHREHGSREADLCFQETLERYSGLQGSGNSARARKNRMKRGALHDCTSQNCESNPTETHWPSWQLLSWPLILTSSHVLFRPPPKFLQRRTNLKCMTPSSFLLPVWGIAIFKRNHRMFWA